MKENKFRIWDKQTKNWLENGNSLHCFSSWTICPFTGNLVDYVGDYRCDSFTSSPAVDYYWQGTTIIKEPRYVIQQYTGLKDKNGKKIYEGDIVKYSRSHTLSVEVRKNVSKTELVEDGDFIGEIVFIFPSFCWSYDYKRYDDIEPMSSASHRYEVVGSIFETPELLK